MFENTKLPEGMNPETLEHLMDPKNYGKLENPSCVGVAVDEKTGEYVIFYTQLEGDMIKDAKYATNGCQDTVVIGSMFSEMIIANNIDYAQGAIKKMHEKLGVMSQQQQVCADIVFSAFIASMINYEHKQEGKEEEMHVLKMKESCEGENIHE
ncbi:MAG TPA: iron-sulfur cluster assembly scaffold protein [Sulfurimonas sp. UBA12504]|nr:MAG: iron-sulfur cluster assembly scaffold protein [Sulfurimonas sp. GWF2_37_8]DAB31065.1 MAG TPA: iron-sulfur cluster assembly scaffold protein [Sulfurimonas sp. UBA12504]